MNQIRVLAKKNVKKLTQADYERSFGACSRSRPDKPASPSYEQYECLASDLLKGATFPVWFTDREQTCILNYDKRGACPIRFTELSKIEFLREQKLGSWRQPGQPTDSSCPIFHVEECTRCGRRVVKDGCHRLLALAHEGKDCPLVIREISGEDWSMAQFDMRVVCACLERR